MTLLAGSPEDCKAPAGGTISSDLVSLSGYDRLNRLNTFRTFGSGVEVDRTTYVYDALDRPYSQRERHGSAGTTREKTFTYLGLSNLLSGETHTNPSVTKTYTYDAFGHRISMTDDDGTPETYGYGYDVHGSVSVLLDDNADAPEATYGYDPYGEIDTELTQGDTNGSEPDKPPDDPLNPYRYTGKRLDSGSGTYDMGARRFAAGSGQFLQQDLYLGALANLSLSLDPLTQNRYALAGGMPTSYIETDGHVPAEDGAGNTGKYRNPEVRRPRHTPGINPVSGEREGASWQNYVASKSGKLAQLEGVGGRVVPYADWRYIPAQHELTARYRYQNDVPIEETGDLELVSGGAGILRHVGKNLVERVTSRVLRSGAAKTDAGLASRGLRPAAGTRVRPPGIPEGWRVRPTSSPGGTWYYDPTNKGNAVRVMQGNPKSPYPNSRGPYVRWQRNGQPLDAAGNVLPSKFSPDAHIPLSQFRFRPEIFE
jgi:RHS repeat-associated protein